MLSISIRKNDSSSLLEMILSGKSYDLPGFGFTTLSSANRLLPVTELLMCYQLFALELTPEQ